MRVVTETQAGDQMELTSHQELWPSTEGHNHPRATQQEGR